MQYWMVDHSFEVVCRQMNWAARLTLEDNTVHVNMCLENRIVSITFIIGSIERKEFERIGSIEDVHCSTRSLVWSKIIRWEQTRSIEAIWNTRFLHISDYIWIHGWQKKLPSIVFDDE
jgi:hypothetical protein